MFTIEINEQEKKILQLGLLLFIKDQKRFIKEYGTKLDKEKQKVLGVSSRETLVNNARKLRNFLIYTVK